MNSPVKLFSTKNRLGSACTIAKVIIMCLFLQYYLVSLMIPKHAIAIPEPVKQKLAIIGILTTPQKFQQRSVIRGTYLRHKPDEIDVKFVMCTPPKQDEDSIRKEAAITDDIIIMDCEENMDNGKSMDWFTFASKFKHKFIFKGDDDVVIHLPKFAEDLKNYDGSVYYGRRCNYGNYFMAGFLYGFSHDLVDIIATNETIRGFRVGFEDRIAKTWVDEIEKQGIKITQVSKDKEFIDHLKSGMGWMADVTEKTTAVHQCKKPEWFHGAYLEMFTFNKP
jgi:hypothetical protein